MPEKKIGVAVVTNSGGQSGVVLNFLAAYVYDRLLGKLDTNQLPNLIDFLTERRKQFVSGVAERAKRPWMLEHPNEAYVGRYENALFGPMVIEQRGDRLYASLKWDDEVFQRVK